jgi:hypothetical protein
LDTKRSEHEINQFIKNNLGGITMKTRLMLLGLTAFSLGAVAGDVTGTWIAEFNTQCGLQKYTFMLTQEGTDFKGKARVEREGEKREAELKERKVEGDTNIDGAGHTLHHDQLARTVEVVNEFL